ncbi:Six-hairpin glycosidase [Tothia fuscella]|uniref:Six-hairpin glycosidase n=1 Tax=Tothia fuscella TaxID=1048955 RepID=A0A9P4NIZ6_9PEZI|nr:Six-hairpin glycosidase [Tothia fuscella]
MKTQGLLTALGILRTSTTASAQSCWRDTKCTGPLQPSFPGPWQTDIYAPPTRSVRPRRILSLPDARVIAQFPNPSSLVGNGSALVYDFGIEVGGIVRVNYTFSGGVGGGEAQLGLAFSESKNYIGEWSDASNGKFKGQDGASYGRIEGEGKGRYIMPDKDLRGGFRYLTLFLKASKITPSSTPLVLNITDIKLELSIQPTWPNLQSYQGYFHSSDELLNSIWYAGAYTLQTCSVPVHTGRQVPMLSNGWANNATMGPGDSILVDGAKRDRAVWPGDMGVAVGGLAVSTGDLESVRNALQVIFDWQNGDGSFPEAGPPLLQQNSDTYHMWTLIGTYNYMLYTNDTGFLIRNWPKYEYGLSYILKKVKPSSGLLHVTGTRDWARWAQGGNNSEANMLLYQTLTTASTLSLWHPSPKPAQSEKWSRLAESLYTSINTHLWDENHGAFKDNATDTKLYPQDANSLALAFNITYPNRTTSISDRLLENWSDIGPITPELPENISPFISSFELEGHFSLYKTSRALNLLRRTWGWYITNPNGTQSTLIEGYRADGTFGYRAERGYQNTPSYVSHSHGWSTGPTSSLTHHIAGISITSPLGKTWLIFPQLGDLSFAEAGFTTSLGKFRVAWQRVDAHDPSTPSNTSTFRDFAGYDVQIDMPLGTEGEVVLPFLEEGVETGVSTYEVSGVEGQGGRWRGDGRSWRRVIGGGRKQFSVRQIGEGEVPHYPHDHSQSRN